MAVGTFIKGVISRVLPAPRIADGGEQASRVSGYGDNYVLGLVPTKHMLADEGSYFVTTNTTPGTGVATAAGPPSSFAATTPLFVIKNNDAAGGKRIYLDYLRLMLTVAAAPASDTSVEAAIVVDSGNRVPTAGTSTLTPLSPNIDSGIGSIAQVYVPNGANPTAPAAVSSRLVGRGRLKNSILTALDVYTMQFGAVDGPAAYTSAAALMKSTENFAPVVIGPQEFALIYIWLPSVAATAINIEFELGQWER